MAKIVVIDDEFFYREIVRDTLEKEGHKVHTAANAREGLDLMQQVSPELALVDIVLPGSMDGLAVLFKIKTRQPELPVIMLTAYEDKKLILSALRRGAFDYLTKPISPQELKHIVDKALERYQLIKEREDKLAKLSQLEQGASRLAHSFGGKINVADMAHAYKILETTVELVSQVLSCDRVSIMLLDPVQSRLKVVISKGWSKDLVKSETRDPKTTISGWVLDNKKAVLVKDVNNDERFKASEYSKLYKTNSFIIAPLFVAGDIVGTINANDKNDGAQFNEDDFMLLKTFSHQVALTLQYLHAISELERDKTRLGLLAELQTILIQGRDPGLMLSEILKKCQEMIDVMVSSIFLRDEFTNELVHQVGWENGKELKIKQRIKWGEAVTGKVASEGKTVILNEPAKNRYFSAALEWHKAAQIQNYLAAPIWVGDQVIGVIRLVNKRRGGFKKPDASLLEEVARSVGIALKNIELYRRLERSVEETKLANQMMSRANEELELKNKELAMLRKKG